MRPYEKVTSARRTKAPSMPRKKVIYGRAREAKENILRRAHAKCKPILAAPWKVDQARWSKPKVSIIGEFWAMTTEGDGNYQLQTLPRDRRRRVSTSSFVDGVDSLHALGSAKNDTKQRADLRELRHQRSTASAARRSARRRCRSWAIGLRRRLRYIVRGLFQTFAHVTGPLRLQAPRHGRRSPSISHELLQQRPPWRRRPHGSRQAHHERRSLEGAHDALA